MTFVEGAQQWRAVREANLALPDGWLTLAGLIWLEQGPNTVGADPQSQVVLPTVADHLGVLTLEGEEVRFTPAKLEGLTINDQPATEQVLRHDGMGQPDKVRLGSVAFVIVKRGERIGVRVFDNNASTRAQFRGLFWYPPQENYRVVGRLIPHATPTQIPIVTMLGDVIMYNSPGYLEFELNGQTHRLLAQSDQSEKYLFFNFKDATSGVTTYGAGRFLTAGGVDEQGRAVIDFNQAINPPCAFSAYATCPLAPAENRLPVAIEAGEKKYPLPDH